MLIEVIHEPFPDGLIHLSHEPEIGVELPHTLIGIYAELS